MRQSERDAAVKRTDSGALMKILVRPSWNWSWSMLTDRKRWRTPCFSSPRHVGQDSLVRMAYLSKLSGDKQQKLCDFGLKHRTQAVERMERIFHSLVRQCTLNHGEKEKEKLDTCWGTSWRPCGRRSQHASLWCFPSDPDTPPGASP